MGHLAGHEKRVTESSLISLRPVTLRGERLGRKHLRRGIRAYPPGHQALLISASDYEESSEEEVVTEKKKATKDHEKKSRREQGQQLLEPRKAEEKKKTGGGQRTKGRTVQRTGAWGCTRRPKHQQRSRGEQRARPFRVEAPENS